MKGLIIPEIDELSEYLGLIGNDPEIIQRRDTFKKIYYGLFGLEAPMDEI